MSKRHPQFRIRNESIRGIIYMEIRVDTITSPKTTPLSLRRRQKEETQ